MKKHLNISKYDYYWKWAKKIRYVLNWAKKDYSSKEITGFIIFQDTSLGYTNQGSVRYLEQKTACILKIYYDRGEVDRVLTNEKYRYKRIEKQKDSIATVQ